MEESIVFGGEIDERSIDQSVGEIDDRLREDVGPIESDMVLGDIDDSGLDDITGVDGGGGGVGAAGLTALASKIPKPITGVATAAALPVALGGAVGAGMLTAMKNASARLQTSANMLGMAWQNTWRPWGDKIDQMLVRPVTEELLSATQDTNEKIEENGMFSGENPSTTAERLFGEIDVTGDDVIETPATINSKDAIDQMARIRARNTIGQTATIEPFDTIGSPADLVASDTIGSPATIEPFDTIGSPAELVPSDVVPNPPPLLPDDIVPRPPELLPGDIVPSPPGINASDVVPNPPSINPPDLIMSEADINASDVILEPLDLSAEDLFGESGEGTQTGRTPSGGEDDESGGDGTNGGTGNNGTDSGPPEGGCPVGTVWNGNACVPIEDAQTGGFIESGGLLNVHQGERVVPPSQVTDRGELDIDATSIGREIARQIDTAGGGDTDTAAVEDKLDTLIRRIDRLSRAMHSISIQVGKDEIGRVVTDSQQDNVWDTDPTVR